jgi:hypothetical protein
VVEAHPEVGEQMHLIYANHRKVIILDYPTINKITPRKLLVNKGLGRGEKDNHSLSIIR